MLYDRAGYECMKYKHAEHDRVHGYIGHKHTRYKSLISNGGSYGKREKDRYGYTRASES